MPKVEISNLVGGRSDLARVCNDRGLLGPAIEVGTDRGQFAKEFLEKWHGETLYCIDPYPNYEEMPWGREPDIIMACLNLRNQLHRVKVCRTTLGEFSLIVRRFPETYPQKYGFIYIDGDHSYWACKDDIDTAATLLASGGLLAGDDYDDSHPGVVQAVNEYAARTGQDIYLTTDYNRGRSWFINHPKLTV